MPKATRNVSTIPKQILNEMSRVIVGKSKEKELLLVAMLCSGHILIEGPHGSAKTTTARTFAKAIGGEFKRVQFTPDMLPSDITGFNLYTVRGDSKFISGPLFANVVLADELNRTTPRTQSALLEAMQENQVTIEGTTYTLPTPFMVIATQVASGAEGTYHLTDVQSDRFMFRITSDYPTEIEERQILANIDFLDAPDSKAITSPETLINLHEQVKHVHVSDKLREYIVSLIDCVRRDNDSISGPSPRGTIALFKGSRALAYLEGRDYAIPDDVKTLAHAALDHRIRLSPEAEIDNVVPETLIQKALDSIPVPGIN
ncbi:MAG: MoxR family ATPase [Chloroflexota bacterium]|nr:MoxR family ATPase [Chloroflexota bacterium]